MANGANDFENGFEEEFDALARRYAPIIALAFGRSVRALARSIGAEAVERLIERRDIARLVSELLQAKAVDAAMSPTRAAIRDVAGKAGTHFFADIPEPGDTGNAAAPVPVVPVASESFDPLNAQTVRAIERFEAVVVREATQTMRETIGAVVRTGLAAGKTPKQIAVSLRDLLGLSRSQVEWLANYEAELRALASPATRARLRAALAQDDTPAALARALSDGTFDRTVRSAILKDRALTEEEIAKGIARYRKNLLDSRATTVARTVTMNTMREAQLAAWDQAIAAGVIGEEDLIETWFTTLDGRERPAHHAMHGMQKPYGEDWIVPGVGPQRYPGEDEFNCLLPNTRVWAPDGVSASVRIFDGEAVTIHTASGHELSCTPNHPILTPRGWIAAGTLCVGDQVVHSTGRQWDASATVNGEDVPPRVEEVAEALLLGDTPMGLGQVEIAAEDFHGDAGNGQVAVVVADRRLLAELHAVPIEQFPEFALPVGLREAETMARNRALHLSLDRVVPAAPSDVGGGNLPGSDLIGRLLPLQSLGSGTTAALDPALTEDASDDVTGAGQRLCETLLAGAGEIALDHIARVERHQFRGHVWNIGTVRGWYIAEGIVTHNCRCKSIVTLRVRRASDIARVRARRTDTGAGGQQIAAD